MLPRHLDRSARQRLLHFRDGRQRNLRRQDGVENVVVAQIGVGEHVVADPLAGPQPAAMADHQPGFRAQHGQMVAYRLRVGRTHPDIDQRDARASFTDQVVGGHLVASPGGIGQLVARVLGRAGQPQTAGAGERGIGVRTQLTARPIDELVDIAVVVGEQDEALEILWSGAGIMRQPRQAEIGAKPVEQRQGDGGVGIGDLDPVGQLVADVGQLGRGEMACQFGRPNLRQLRSGSAIEDVGERYLLPRRLHGDLDRVIVLDELELLAQVIREQVRPCHGRRVSAGNVQPAESMAAVGRLIAPGKSNREFGIGVAAVAPPFGRGQRAVPSVGENVVAQPRDRGVVKSR